MEISILSEIFLEKCDFLGVNCLEKCKKHGICIHE